MYLLWEDCSIQFALASAIPLISKEFCHLCPRYSFVVYKETEKSTKVCCVPFSCRPYFSWMKNDRLIFGPSRSREYPQTIKRPTQKEVNNLWK